MAPEDIVAFWGADNLRRWSPDALRGVKIPQSSKDFLIRVGLPTKDVGWTMRFDDEAASLPRMPGKSTYRRIGFDDFVPICLDEARNGSVMLIDPPWCAENDFVNSSVEAFGQFVMWYQQYRQDGPGLTEPEVEPLIAETERRMRDRDAAAFADGNNFWPVILEQMYNGML